MDRTAGAIARPDPDAAGGAGSLAHEPGGGLPDDSEIGDHPGFAIDEDWAATILGLGLLLLALLGVIGKGMVP